LANNRTLEYLRLKLLRTPSYTEVLILLAALSLNLLDSLTTLTVTLTGRGVELNPVLRMLLNINPFLVYPFLISTLIPILLFRFNPVVEYGVATLMITIHLVATLNNVGVIISRHTLAIPLLENLDIQFLAFLTGLIYIAGFTLYICIRDKLNRWRSIKLMIQNYALYLLAYLALGLIPIIWLIAIRT